MKKIFSLLFLIIIIVPISVFLEVKIFDSVVYANNYPVTAVAEREFDNGIFAISMEITDSKTMMVCVDYDKNGIPDLGAECIYIERADSYSKQTVKKDGLIVTLESDVIKGMFDALLAQGAYDDTVYLEKKAMASDLASFNITHFTLGSSPSLDFNMTTNDMIDDGRLFERHLGSLKTALEARGHSSVSYDFNYHGKSLSIGNFSSISKNMDICGTADNPCSSETDEDILSIINEISNYCKDISIKHSNNAGTSDDSKYQERFEECVSFVEFVDHLGTSGFTASNYYAECDLLSSDLKNWIQDLFGLFAIFAPILAVGLGIVDFIKVIVKGDADKELKTAFKKFLTRVGMAVLLLLVPLLISFILDIFPLESINSDDPFCGIIDFEQLNNNISY